MIERKHPKSDKTTCEKGGREPPNITLNEIFNGLLTYIGKSPHLNNTYENIEKKYDIKKESDGCWPEDDIKRAWGKTQRMDNTSLKRKRWSLAIMLQLIKRPNFKECTGKEAQPDQSNEKAHEKDKGEGSNKPDSQSVYIRIPISVMFKNESASQERGRSGEKDNPSYKLIDRFPFLQEIKKRKSYVMLYNNQTRNAAWVYEILNRETLKDKVKNKDSFRYEDDTKDPLYEAAKNIEECNESDYERGHLASAANHKWCQEAYEDTFFLSNMAPQVPAFNQGLWEKLEEHCRNKIDNQNDIRNVHVYSGPLYLLSSKKKGKKLKIWKSKVVPTHFFKVIIVEHMDGKVELECYEMANEKPEDKISQSKVKNIKSNVKNKSQEDELEIYRVSIKQIETDSGLKFTESSCADGQYKEIDSIRKVKWENAEKSCKIKVKVSTPLTDHNDFVYI